MEFQSFENIEWTFVFDSKINWQTIAIFWWIHWDEVVWEKTIKYFLEKFKNKELKVLKWKIIFAYGNLKAMQIRKREFTANLNRVFRKELLEKPSEIYEINRAKQLAKILDNSDVLLDLHSVSSKSEPFMFSENTEKDLELAKNIFDWKIIVWYWEISDDSIAWDTENYMHKQGKQAHTLECGNHNLENSEEIWIEVSKNILWYFWIIDYKKQTKNNWDFYKIKDIFTTKTWKFIFSKIYDNLDFIKKWEIIWKDLDQEIIAKEDFYIIMPSYSEQKIWKEIFFYWNKI